LISVGLERAPTLVELSKNVCIQRLLGGDLRKEPVEQSPLSA
jgi:hypothetical protein